MENTVLVWLRNDLRLHDNEALYKAAVRTKNVVPFVCIDPRQFASTPLGFTKTGARRAQFLLESVADLRQRLQSIGSNLVVRIGQPADVVAELQSATGATLLYTSQEVTSEELADEQAVESVLQQRGARMFTFWQSTLYHVDDIPFRNIGLLPDVFTEFRKQTEKAARVRDIFPVPAKPNPVTVEIGNIPTLEDLGLLTPEQDSRTLVTFKGGETAALERLQQYFWKQDLLKVYKETRNGLLGADFSSKFSPWLALGCLSPRYVFDQVRQYEAKRVKNDSTYWLIFELIWRDYFRFVALKYGTRLFKKGGIKQDIKAQQWIQNESLFQKWMEGKTGIPFIDANMQELAATGFMSNRGRQNVASFLVKDLKIDWRWGAMYFEHALLDYDVCSNWGNWNYVAGIGNDPREDRYFNILKQAKQYDPNGEFVKHWLPVLKPVPAATVHVVGDLSRDELQRYGIRLGSNYPFPMVKNSKWMK
ncbi:DASH family cryptochrome [Rhodoflexus caldus]|uniref:DASH family cryptochrome n=1 Tax=Rhodoflexus caldus TaxID=2891236 RepID=UPI00202A987C|nr:DASH family cryptochrome [Rhodoflexus caldus]